MFSRNGQKSRKKIAKLYRNLQDLLARRSFSRRSRKTLKNAYFDAKIGVDTAENEPRCPARRDARPPRARPPPPSDHSFGGSFSAGSTPIFASKYAFCSIFQNLQENHLLASKFWKNLKILKNSENFSKFLVDLEKCRKMRIWTRKSALIQPRTSLGKTDGPR